MYAVCTGNGKDRGIFGMAKPRKDKELEETRRIMERLVNTPHKPHKPLQEGKIRMGEHDECKSEKKRPRQRSE